LAVFLVCTWSGQTLARHHQDAHEVGAVVAIGACVLGALALGRNLEVEGFAPLLVLALAAGGGLFVGYDRSDRPR
jgi:hypothetical protein